MTTIYQANLLFYFTLFIKKTMTNNLIASFQLYNKLLDAHSSLQEARDIISRCPHVLMTMVDISSEFPRFGHKNVEGQDLLHEAFYVKATPCHWACALGLGDMLNLFIHHEDVPNARDMLSKKCEYLGRLPAHFLEER